MDREQEGERGRETPQSEEMCGGSSGSKSTARGYVDAVAGAIVPNKVGEEAEGWDFHGQIEDQANSSDEQKLYPLSSVL